MTSFKGYPVFFPVGVVREMLAHSEASAERSPTFEQMADGALRHDGRTLDLAKPGLEDFELLTPEAVDPTRVPAGLWLVGDSGVYLMSNGKPGQKDENHPDPRQCLVAYALGMNPDLDESYYETKRQVFGGDDGCLFLPANAFEDQLHYLRNTDYLCLDLADDAIIAINPGRPIRFPIQQALIIARRYYHVDLRPEEISPGDDPKPH